MVTEEHDMFPCMEKANTYANAVMLRLVKSVRSQKFVQGELTEEGDEEEEDDDSTGKVKRTKERQVFVSIAEEEILKFANCQGMNADSVCKRPKDYFWKLMTGFNMRQYGDCPHGNPHLMELAAIWASVRLGTTHPNNNQMEVGLPGDEVECLLYAAHLHAKEHIPGFAKDPNPYWAFPMIALLEGHLKHRGSKIGILWHPRRDKDEALMEARRAKCHVKKRLNGTEYWVPKSEEEQADLQQLIDEYNEARTTPGPAVTLEAQPIIVGMSNRFDLLFPSTKATKTPAKGKNKAKATPGKVSNKKRKTRHK